MGIHYALLTLRAHLRRVRRHWVRPLPWNRLGGIFPVKASQRLRIRLEVLGRGMRQFRGLVELALVTIYKSALQKGYERT